MRRRIAAAMGLACLVGALSGCAGSSSESRARGIGNTEACGTGPLPVDTTSGPQFLAPMGRLAGLTRQNIPVPAVDVDDARPRVMEDADPKLVPRLDASPYLSLGQAWFDRDNDGDLDVYFSGQTRGGALYDNQGDGTFCPVAAGAAAVADKAGGGVAAADFDNDGYVDLFVTTNRSGNVLLHNDNGRGFSDVTQSAGVAGTGSDPSMSAAWGDFDSDGWADLYVTNYGCQPCRRASDGRVTYQLEDGARSDGVADRLYRNRGDGTFEDLTAALGGIPETLGFGFQASWSDLDLDGDSDLYLVNDVRDTEGLFGNVLIRNDGPGCTSWCFTGLSAVSGSAIRINGMGLAIGDIDNDGDSDLYMSNTGLAEHPQLPVLLRNDGGLRFTDVSATSGAQLLEMTWGADFADLNGDGWLDLVVASAMSAGAERGKCTAAVLSPLVPTVALSEIETFCASPAFTNNAVLLGGPGTRFTRQPLAYGGADGADTLSIVAVDVDGDRRPDVSGANLVTPPGIFRNTDGREPTIAVDVKHAGQHRTALGTRIEVRVPARPELGVQSRELRSGSSLGASVGGSAVFGLNGASEAQVDVLFADGTRLSRTLRPGDFWDVSR